MPNDTSFEGQWQVFYNENIQMYSWVPPELLVAVKAAFANGWHARSTRVSADTIKAIEEAHKEVMGFFKGEGIL